MSTHEAQASLSDPTPQGETASRAQKFARAQVYFNEKYPNDFRRSHTVGELRTQYESMENEALERQSPTVFICGRLVAERHFGKLTFLKLTEASGTLQIMLSEKVAGPESYAQWSALIDLGDVVGCSGTLFKTRTGELTLKCTQLRLLSKSLRALPGKFHGLADRELCQRQRYLDLLSNPATMARFQQRCLIVKALRSYFCAQGFLEVETPMMHPIPGGAVARPFVTHHNGLDCPLYLRVAPELYLKRLIIGGFEKIFELNRNFRNEGLSTRHNPEFTMLEFYQAYEHYHYLMDLIEQLLRTVAQQVLGRLQFQSEGVHYDLHLSFERLSLRNSLQRYWPQVPKETWQDREATLALVQSLGLIAFPEASLGELQLLLFEKFIEATLIQPTFITDYPTEVSPLARRKSDDPSLTERFELFVGGRELANGFSELNDPKQQAEAFQAQLQARAGGDEEAMYYDEDYVEALEYGLPPTAGAGIGVDRLVMWLTGTAAIREVLLFPTMRPVT